MAKKEKKKSITKQAVEAIEKEYSDKDKELLQITGVSIKGKALSNCFAAIDNEKVIIYEFTNDKELIEIDSFLWRDWEDVEIDHFAVKSEFTFSEGNRRKELIISDGKGKEVESIIRNYTRININIIKRKRYNKIIGFRSGKKWKMVVAIIGYLIIISAIVNVITDDKKDTTEVASESIEKEQPKNKEKKKEEKKDKKDKKDKKEKDNRTIDEILEEDNGNVDKATLKDGILTLEREPSALWDENSLFHTVYDLFEVMEIAFKDESVNEVVALVKTKMVDNKGNESVENVIEFVYTSESFNDLNFENFSEMAYGQQWRILNESDLYMIHPGIYKNLKDKYTDNLVHGITKLPPVE